VLRAVFIPSGGFGTSGLAFALCAAFVWCFFFLEKRTDLNVFYMVEVVLNPCNPYINSPITFPAEHPIPNLMEFINVTYIQCNCLTHTSFISNHCAVVGNKTCI
jgi:hypothetical protein